MKTVNSTPAQQTLKATSIAIDPQALQRVANRIARAAGHSVATEIVLGERNEVLRHVRYGYRKITTGEYVPGAYRSNFGWKNTFYQHASTRVSVAIADLQAA